MNCLLAAVLLPLHFTAPADTLGVDASGRVHVSSDPVHAYVFQQLEANRSLADVPGYASPDGSVILTPHAPGSRETAWLAPAAGRNTMTVYVRSLDANGNMSMLSNGVVLASGAALARPASHHAVGATLEVPIVRQARERCGQAALTMVLRYYRAAPAALHEVDGAYDPVLRGSLITDLASAARRAGYEADIATLTADSLIALLNDGVPPILLYQNGTGPVTVRHFGVVTGWDATRSTFILQDGTARPHLARRDDLVKRWETAGSQALIVRLSVP